LEYYRIKKKKKEKGGKKEKMPIANFWIRKIEAKREIEEGKEGEKGEGKKKVDVRSNFTISSIERKKSEKLGEYLKVNFKFDVEYTPALGAINLEGELWYYSKEEDMKNIVDEKEDKIYLKGEVANEISTVILQESIVEAIEIAKKLRLPVPIKLPQVNIKQEKMQFNKAS
jgi:hypothetical protein